MDLSGRRREVAIEAVAARTCLRGRHAPPTPPGRNTLLCPVISMLSSTEGGEASTVASRAMHLVVVRRFSGFIVLVRTVCGLLGCPWRHPLRRERNVRMPIGQAVHRDQVRTSHLRRMDDFIGGRDSFAIVTREVDATAALLREGHLTEPIRSALLAALAELCQLACRVLDDAGRHDEATRYYVVGERAAEAAGDLPLTADLLSTLRDSRANTGNTEDAVLLARSAAITGQSHAPPVGRALLRDRAAWAHAKNGDADHCLRAHDAAGEAFSHADEDERPTWVYWLNGDELDVMAGCCFTELDRPDQAAPLLLDALDGYEASHVRVVALYRSWLGDAYAKEGDVDQACAETMHMLDAVEGVSSARVHGRVIVLRRALHRYADVPAGHEVEERSQAVMKTA
jgi:hypothetical protein